MQACQCGAIDICPISEICLVIGGLNNSVDRGFSKLTNLLTDKRLRMSHASMDNCLLIAVNSNSFNNDEKGEMIKNATAKYSQKSRRNISSLKKFHSIGFGRITRDFLIDNPANDISC